MTDVGRFAGAFLGQSEARDLWMAERRPRNLLDDDRVRGVPGDRLDRDDALLLCLVGERRPADEVTDREHLLVRGALVVVDLDAAALVGLDARRFEVQRIGVGTAPARHA